MARYFFFAQSPPRQPPRVILATWLGSTVGGTSPWLPCVAGKSEFDIPLLHQSFGSFDMASTHQRAAALPVRH